MAILRTLPGLLLLALATSGALADDSVPGTDAGTVENVSPDGTLPPVDSDEGVIGDGEGGISDGDPGGIDDGGIVDGDGSVDEGYVDDGSGDDGAVDDGTIDDGTVDDGMVDDGVIDDGAGGEDGAVGDDGYVDDGTVDDGTIEDEYADDGSIDDGTIEDEYADDGSIDDGGIDYGSGDTGEEGDYADDGGLDDGKVIEIGDEGVYGGTEITLDDGTVVLRDASASDGPVIYTMNLSGGTPGDVPVAVDSMLESTASPESAPTTPGVSLDLTDALGAALHAPSDYSTPLDAAEPLDAILEAAETPTAAANDGSAPARVQIRGGHLVNAAD